MRLETDRLILREWQDGDRDAFLAIVSDPHVMRYFLNPLTPEQADIWLDKMRRGFDEGTAHFFAVERKDDGALLGRAGTARLLDMTLPTNPDLEIGWLLASNYWGKGYAPEAARAALAHAFDNLDAPEVVAYTAAINAPSRRVMEKIGMRYDPSADFEHPRIPEGHRLRPHVLYRISRPA